MNFQAQNIRAAEEDLKAIQFRFFDFQIALR